MGLSWESLKQEPPSVYLAFLEMSLGFVCFLSLFHALISIVGVLKLKNGQVLSYADNVSLSCKMVSAVFAVISCIMGVVILRDCGCISFKVKHNIVKHYMCFGLPYFFYDIYAMYIVFKVASSNPQHGTFKTMLTFIQSRFLLVAHHLILPFFIFPVFMGGLQSFNGGDCLVAAGFLLEASTPFVSMRKIFAILGMKKSIWYIINGAVMTIVFFFCRVIFFPCVYYLYSIEHGASILETMTKHVPPICSISMLVLFLPQIYWFCIMVRGGIKVLCGKDVKDKDD